ncbi:MAG: TRAP transporter large permease subunit [OCS116 cluster bacterium]|uniref:C4-dicarboxylate ABC transporter permease n=1 Tax=OCS116 cluster bacterium TaxID=2030921 RepID=A0A2A4Z921_9PROT|nr:TRAP transporter large permease subunit [OCS116 cluster bacterium]
MSSSIVLFLLLFALMFSGMPIAISLGLSSILTMLFFTDTSMASIALKMIDTLTEHYTLLAIPFFILSSAFLSNGGVAGRMIRFAIACVGHIRGGLAMASVMACMLFAAVSGSSPATVAAIGSIVIVGMVKSGYPKPFAAGVISTAGTLGILIPPSIVMLIYAAATEVSAARMFMAGLVPGLAMGCFLILAIYVVARIKKFPAEKFPGIGEIVQSFGGASGGLFMILFVLYIIYGGIASPTEAASISAIYAFIMAVFVYRDIGPLKNTPWKKPDESTGGAAFRGIIDFVVVMVKSSTDKDVKKVVLEAAKVSIMLLFIISNAMLFAHILTLERIPHFIAGMIVDAQLPAWGFLIVVNIVLLIAGNFMEPSAIILIMAPILFPIAMQLGIDPIHLGIIMVVNMEIGMITPPVGLNLFVTAGITKESMGWVIKSAAPWLLLMLAFLGLITYVPQISLFVPELVDSLKGYK